MRGRGVWDGMGRERGGVYGIQGSERSEGFWDAGWEAWVCVFELMLLAYLDFCIVFTYTLNLTHELLPLTVSFLQTKM